MQEVSTLPPKEFEVKLTIENSIKLDPQNPIPIQYGGTTFAILTNKRYIPFLGLDDNLPNLLLEARLISPTQNACISSIASCTIGNGIAFLENTDPDTELLKWLRAVNQHRQSFNEILYGIVDGERTNGNHFVEIKKGNVNNVKFIKIFNHSMLECRFGEEGKDGYPHFVLISKKFAKRGGTYTRKPKDALEIPLWSDNPIDQKSVWKKNGDGTESTILHIKNEVAGVDHYGLPASVAGMRHQILEGKSAQFNIDNFENNMILGGLLILKSAMTAEEAKANAKRILLSHTGEGKTGRIAVISSESGLSDVEFQQYNTQREGSYLEFDKRIEEKIISCNNWDSTLAGFNRNSSLGNGSQYIRSIYDVKDAVLLNPLRLKIIEKIVIPVLKIYAEWHGKKKIAEYKPVLVADMPFSFMSDIDPENILTVDEGRALVNEPPLEDKQKGKKLISEVNSKNNVQSKPAATQDADNNG